MKFLFVLLIFLTTLSKSLSQSTDLNVKDFKVSSSSKVNSDSIQIGLEFVITNPTNLKTLTLRYGSQDGGGDIIAKQLVYVQKDGKEYLQDNESLFQINNGKILITKTTYKEALANKSYINAEIIDKKGIKNNVKDTKDKI